MRLRERVTCPSAALVCRHLIGCSALICEETDFRPGAWSGSPEQSAERRMFGQNLLRLALSQRGHIQPLPGEAGHGRTRHRKGPLAQQFTRRTKAVETACRRTRGPVVSCGIGGSAVGAAIVTRQCRQNSMTGAAASGSVEVPGLYDTRG